MNNVRLYSNGTAVISREYVFKDQEPLRISIPVRKTDLDDVISSLSVFGDVTVSEPPTYTPTNAGGTALTLDPANALTDLATKLAGASVEIEAGTAYQGKLVGLHRYRREAHGVFLQHCRIVILTDKGVQQVEDASVTAIRFTDAAVQAEIDRALQSNLGRIRPDSSKVELTVRPNPGATGAFVTYATPVAAWKIRYQLRMSLKGAELEGQAVVDNDTDDDWSQTLITVINGEPITFSTDLAEVRRPGRSRVNVVADHATGAVSAAEVMSPISGDDFSEDLETLAPLGPASPYESHIARSPRVQLAYEMARAEQSQAEVRESGDFSAFTSPDLVNVAAKSSVIVPLFRAAIGEAQVILFYKEWDDPRRPFRAVRFKNQATHSLGRGVCEVFVDGDFQGKCVLESTKPGDEMLLIHAKETGVRIFKEVARPESRRMAIKISDGIVSCEELSRQETVYRVRNSHPDTFPLEIEHPRTMHGSRLEVTVSPGVREKADIPGGLRIRVTLNARGSLTVNVKEERVEQQRISLDASWLRANVIDLEAPESKNVGVERCVSLQEELDGLEAEIAEKEEEAETIAEEQERLIKLIPNGHGEQANAWRTDLADAEKELREVKRSVVPKLKGRLREVQSDLDDALSGLRYEWSEQPQGRRR